MERKIGTSAYALRTPIIKEGDNLKEIVFNSLLESKEYGNFEIENRDILTITESLLARAQGNYVDFNLITECLNELFDKEINVVFPILSRNRFSIIMKAIGATGKKVNVYLSYPNDEVGNSIISKYTLLSSNVNVYQDTLDEDTFREIAGDEILHPFTGMDYLNLYKSYATNDNITIYMSNNLEDISKNSDEILVCNIHERERLVEYFKNHGVKTVYSLKDVLNKPINGSGFNEEYGLYGSNLSSHTKLKLFPRDSQKFVEELQDYILEKTGKLVEVMIYGDGAFKDPVGHIWELADPVVSPGYTKGLRGLPNELKLKYIADNELEGQNNLEEMMMERISQKDNDLKGQEASLGTTPRQITDLVGSLSDLMSGSGDKGTPVIYIKGYFDNYASK